MSFFEILFIVFFLVIPILDGIQKKRREEERKRQGGAGPGRPGRPGPGQAGPGAGPSEAPTSAADMVPEDLWELLTGQKKPGTQQRTPEPAPLPEPARPQEPDPSPEPVSARYGEPRSADLPEAVSLEVPAPEPVVRRVPSAEERHREFHELVDHPQAHAQRHHSRLVRTLRRPTGLQQAVLLQEVLGPPKGLQ